MAMRENRATLYSVLDLDFVLYFDILLLLSSLLLSLLSLYIYIYIIHNCKELKSFALKYIFEC